MRNKAEILRNAARRATLRDELSAELTALTAELTALGVTTLAYDPVLVNTSPLSNLRSCIEWAKETIVTAKFIRAAA